MDIIARLANLPGALPGACAQGLIWGIMAIGVYLTYRILDVADLTVDGSFGTGGAVCVMCLLSGQNVWVSLLMALLAGLLSGFITGVLHTFMGIPAILAGILTQLSLYSINLKIMGKANQAINSELYAYCKDQMDNNRVRFLITSEDAKKRIADKKMPPQKREEYLIPYVMTDILFEQMMNLVRDTEKNRNSQLIILDQSNTRIRKDKFSALLYALSYCQKFDDRTTRRKGVGQNRWMLFSKG